MHSSSMPRVRHPAPLAHTLSPLAAAVLLLACGTALAQGKEISFGIISTESTANLKSTWQPVLDDMQKATGLTVKAFFAPDYAGVIEGMRFNKVQVAWMGNKSAMEAVDRSQGEVFAKVTQADGAPVASTAAPSQPSADNVPTVPESPTPGKGVEL